MKEMKEAGTEYLNINAFEELNRKFTKSNP